MSTTETIAQPGTSVIVGQKQREVREELIAATKAFLGLDKEGENQGPWNRLLQAKDTLQAVLNENLDDFALLDAGVHEVLDEDPQSIIKMFAEPKAKLAGWMTPNLSDENCTEACKEIVNLMSTCVHYKEPMVLEKPAAGRSFYEIAKRIKSVIEASDCEPEQKVAMKAALQEYCTALDAVHDAYIECSKCYFKQIHMNERVRAEQHTTARG